MNKYLKFKKYNKNKIKLKIRFKKTHLKDDTNKNSLKFSYKIQENFKLNIQKKNEICLEKSY